LDGDGQLRRAARLIRDFHDAVAGFTPPPGAQWQVLMPADGDEIIAHHDLAPWNLVIADREWAFIDWDVAAPGTRLWDLACAMHDFLAEQAARGAQPWTRLWNEGHGDVWQADAGYITRREHQWQQALLA
jgi:thiamine kinase-like enzyme